MSFHYVSQIDWLFQRAHLVLRTHPPLFSGQPVSEFDLIAALDRNERQVREEKPSFSLDMQVFLSEFRTFKEFWGEENEHEFPRPTMEITDPITKNLSIERNEHADHEDVKFSPEDKTVEDNHSEQLSVRPTTTPASGQMCLSKVEASMQVITPKLTYLIQPPRHGWDKQTGFPNGSVIFYNRNAFQMIRGPDRAVLFEFNRFFPGLRIRFEAPRGEKFCIIWVEVYRAYSILRHLPDQKAATYGIQMYRDMYDGGVLPLITTFYSQNSAIFHPAKSAIEDLKVKTHQPSFGAGEGCPRKQVEPHRSFGLKPYPFSYGPNRSIGRGWHHDQIQQRYREQSQSLRPSRFYLHGRRSKSPEGRYEWTEREDREERLRYYCWSRRGKSREIKNERRAREDGERYSRSYHDSRGSDNLAYESPRRYRADRKKGLSRQLSTSYSDGHRRRKSSSSTDYEMERKGDDREDDWSHTNQRGADY